MPTAAPRLSLAGRAAAWRRRRGVRWWHVSLTHTDLVAVASVVAEGDGVNPVVTVAEMRAIDEEALATVDHDTLVDRAGTAVATAALRLLGGAYGRRSWWWPGRAPTAPTAGWRPPGSAGAAPGWRWWRRPTPPTGWPPRPGRPGHRRRLRHRFPRHLHGALGPRRRPASWPWTSPRVSTATPGRPGGEPLRADVTVTFAALKPGLLQGDGPLLAGRVEVVDIGLDVTGPGSGWWRTPTWPASCRSGPGAPTNGSRPWPWWPVPRG